MNNLVICESPNTLALRAAESIVEIARQSLETRGRFTLALCGGSTPEKTYLSLTLPQYKTSIDWARTYIFFGDERFVPHEDSRSNFWLAEHTLLLHVPILASQVFPVQTEWSSAAKAAKAYERELLDFFGFPKSEPGRLRPRLNREELPRFDLILLGLGEDGHTASLFPGSAALKVEDALVTWSLPGTLPPPVDRITFTYPLLNAARNVIFLVSGEQKAAILHEVLEGTASYEDYPAKGIQPHEGRLTWYLDNSAAKDLTPRLLATSGR
jgi:6-phosphogluconolactonase